MSKIHFTSCIRFVRLWLLAWPDRADTRMWRPSGFGCPWGRKMEWRWCLMHWKRLLRSQDWCRTCSRARKPRTCECDRLWECQRRAVAEWGQAHPDCPMARFDVHDISRCETGRQSQLSVRDSWGSKTRWIKCITSGSGIFPPTLSAHIIKVSTNDVHITR